MFISNKVINWCNVIAGAPRINVCKSRLIWDRQLDGLVHEVVHWVPAGLCGGIWPASEVAQGYSLRQSSCDFWLNNVDSFSREEISVYMYHVHAGLRVDAFKGDATLAATSGKARVWWTFCTPSAFVYCARSTLLW